MTVSMIDFNAEAQTSFQDILLFDLAPRPAYTAAPPQTYRQAQNFIVDTKTQNLPTGRHLQPTVKQSTFVTMDVGSITLFEDDAKALSQEELVIQQTASDRLLLLSRKYEGSVSSREDEARIMVLTERLRRLQPRVDGKAWETIERLTAKAEESDSLIAELKAEFGIA